MGTVVQRDVHELPIELDPAYQHARRQGDHNRHGSLSLGRRAPFGHFKLEPDTRGSGLTWRYWTSVAIMGAAVVLLLRCCA